MPGYPNYRCWPPMITTCMGESKHPYRTRTWLDTYLLTFLSPVIAPALSFYLDVHAILRNSARPFGAFGIPTSIWDEDASLMSCTNME